MATLDISSESRILFLPDIAMTGFYGFEHNNLGHATLNYTIGQQTISMSFRLALLRQKSPVQPAGHDSRCIHRNGRVAQRYLRTGRAIWIKPHVMRFLALLNQSLLLMRPGYDVIGAGTAEQYSSGGEINRLRPNP